MESIPERLNELLALIAEGGTASDEQRVQAVSRVADLLSKDSFLPAERCLIDCVRYSLSERLVNHTMTVLGQLVSTESVPVLIDVLLGTHVALYEQAHSSQFLQTDPSLRLRCRAALVLGKIQDGRAIIPLMSILNNRLENYRLRLAAAESLGKLGDHYAVPPLIEILADEREKSIYLKESVAKALGMLGDIRAVQPLIDMFESKQGIRDKFNFLKEQIIEAMGRIVSPQKKGQDKTHDRVTQTLIQALKDEAPSIRLAAVDSLSTIGDVFCVAALADCVDDENDEVAKAAIHAIYHLGGEDAIRALLTRENLPRFLREELEGYIP